MTERIRTNNDLNTPAWLIVRVEQIEPIALDPCSNPWSKVGALRRLQGSGPGDDGLTADWLQDGMGGLVFVNPPYGRGHMRQWAQKIANEARAGCEIIALVKGDFSTAWWRTLRGEAAAIGYVRERIAFEGGEHGSGNFASALFYFGPRAHLFAHMFADVADVRVLRAGRGAA